MFSMLFITCLRPEYKLYCDSKLQNQWNAADKSSGIEREDIVRARLSFCEKLRFIFCCKETTSIVDHEDLPEKRQTNIEETQM